MYGGVGGMVSVFGWSDGSLTGDHATSGSQITVKARPADEADPLRRSR